MRLDPLDGRSDDRAFVMSLIKDNGYMIKHASSRLKNDKELVLEAMKHCDNKALILFLASNSLYEDEQMRLAAKYDEYLDLLLEVVKGGR